LDHAERQIWCNASVVFISNGPLDIALLQIDKVPIELNTIRPKFVCPTTGSSVYVVGHGRFVSEPMYDYEWLEKKTLIQKLPMEFYQMTMIKKSPISFSGRSNGTKRTFRNHNLTK
jgi:hypothetical protein